MNPALTQALIELEQHVDKEGWDQHPRLFALVDTAELIAAEPRLAAALAPETLEFEGQIGPLRTYTSIEQEGVATDTPLDEMLAGIAWPPTVHGAALVVERLMLPPSAQEQLPDGEADADAWVAAHPERQEVRIAVGVLRTDRATARCGCATRTRTRTCSPDRTWCRTWRGRSRTHCTTETRRDTPRHDRTHRRPGSASAGGARPASALPGAL